MKTNTIRLICLLLSLTMLFTMTGCKGKNNKKTTSEMSSDTADVQTSSEEDGISVEDDGSTVEEPVSDDAWGYDELPEEEPEQTDDLTRTAQIQVYNNKPVQSSFLGFNAVYHAFAYMDDNWGRKLTDEMADLEIGRAIKSGTNIVRTFYEMQWAWDTKTKAWDWESGSMKAFYKWSNALKAGGVDVLMNHWFQAEFLLNSYHWSDTSKEGSINQCHEGVLVPGDQQATLQKFGKYMSDSVRQMQAHGCTNVKYISIATEPGAWWSESWGTEAERAAYQEKCAKSLAGAINAVHQQLIADRLRGSVLIQGPNISGEGDDAKNYLYYFKQYCNQGAVDLWSAHKYNGNDPATDYYTSWDEQIKTYSSSVPATDFCFDEYGMAAGSQTMEMRPSNYYGFQMAIANMAFLNNGLRSSFIWTLFDQQWPNNYTTNNDSFIDGVQFCGMAPTVLKSTQLYPMYYYYELVCKTMGVEGSKIYRGDDTAYDGAYAAMSTTPTGDISFMVINNDLTDVNVKVELEKSIGGRTLYRHVYDPNTIRTTPEGYLIQPDKQIKNVRESFYDIITPYSVAFYTTMKICK